MSSLTGHCQPWFANQALRRYCQISVIIGGGSQGQITYYYAATPVALR
jgi:hypothetical protein